MISTSDGGMICASVPGRGDDAAGEAAVVTVAQHDGQRDQTHRYHRCRDDAGGRREQRADEDHRVGEPAAHRSEHLSDGVEQILGHAASLEDQAHEGEKRHGEQRVVRHHAPDALRKRLDQRGRQQTELDAHQSVEDADGGQRERHREADQQHDDQRHEHQRRDVRDQESAHRSASLTAWRRTNGLASASCRIARERPCGLPSARALIGCPRRASAPGRRFPRPALPRRAPEGCPRRAAPPRFSQRAFPKDRAPGPSGSRPA